MRNCDNCGVCCTGLIPGDAHGKEFYFNKPCFYLEDKLCSIYNDNMPTACKNYRCAWLDDESIPDNLDPRITNGVLMKTGKGDFRVFMDSDDSDHEYAFVDFARLHKIRLIIHLLNQNIVKVVHKDGQIQTKILS
jgi:uncharacterized cysteine cluster protein YcgN (CxxCxxCC family)